MKRGAWDRPSAWWSAGLTAPLYMCADVRPHECWGDGVEIRVGNDGVAYTAEETIMPLLLRELPTTPAPEGGRDGT